MDQIPSTSCDAFLTPADRLALGMRRVGAVRLTDIEPTNVGWLWPGRIPLGYVTLLVSDPGAGKSLVALDIAARVTTGKPWPDANDETRMTNDEPSSHSSFDIRHSSFD
jgi:AAA domain